MKLLLMLIIILGMVGCAASVKTVVVDPDGKEWTMWSQDDARVALTQTDQVFEVDNRGRPSWIEGLLQFALTKPDINLGNQEGD